MVGFFLSTYHNFARRHTFTYNSVHARNGYGQQVTLSHRGNLQHQSYTCVIRRLSLASDTPRALARESRRYSVKRPLDRDVNGLLRHFPHINYCNHNQRRTLHLTRFCFDQISFPVKIGPRKNVPCHSLLSHVILSYLMCVFSRTNVIARAQNHD